MTRPVLRLALATAAVAAMTVGVRPASATSDTLADRHAAFVRARTQENVVTRLFGRLAPTLKPVRDLTRYSIRLLSGEVNPKNIAVFGSDFEAASRARLAERLRADEAHRIATGRGVVVAVLDGGFNLAHPEIAHSVLPYQYDSVERDFDCNDTGNGLDDDGDGRLDLAVGHGTFVAGMVLRAAPDARILPVKIADDEGYGTEAELIDGIRYAIDMGVDVLNLSFEAGQLSTGTLSMLHEAERAGICVVVSAGNSGRDAMESVAAQEFTLSVGAVDDADCLATFSNQAGWRQTLHVVAPGVDLVGPHGGGRDDSCAVWSGTSFSAPLAAGAAALLREMEPGCEPGRVRRRIASCSAIALDRDGSSTLGAGRLDLLHVVQAVQP